MEVHALFDLLVVLYIFGICTSNDDICTNDGDCQLIDYTTAPAFCHSMSQFYNTTRFPTTLHESQEIATIELASFQSIHTHYSSCSEAATNFLCIFYIPPCLSVGSDCVLVLRPCRSLCQEVNDCLLRVYNLDLEIMAPPYLHCSNFDSSQSGQCWGRPPTAASTTTSTTINRTSVTTATADLVPSISSHGSTSEYNTEAFPFPDVFSSSQPLAIITPSLTLQHPSLFTSAYSVGSPTPSYTSTQSSQEPSLYSFTSRSYHGSSPGSLVISPTSSLPHTQTSNYATRKHNDRTIIKSSIQPSQSTRNLELSQGFIKAEAMLSMVLCIGWIAVAFTSCCM